MLPNFLLIGTAKGGTNALHTYLRAHPDVFMPDTKELKFFAHDEVWANGLDWYSNLFPDGYKLRGEGSVQYTMYPQFPDVVERISKSLPDIRFIYLMRDPIKRMQSQYRHQVALGLEKEPIEWALLRDWPSLEPYQRPENKPLYIHYSMYALQIERYLDVFPRDRMLLATSEALLNDRVETMRKVLAFLDLDPEWTAPVVEKEFHKAEDRRTLRAPALHARVQAVPGYRTLTKLAPKRMKEALAPILVKNTDPGESVIHIPDHFRSELHELLRPDVAKLKDLNVQGFDGWGIL